MHLSPDYLSIWELGHRWHEVDPNTSEPLSLPLPVQDTLRSLTHALTHDDLHVLNQNGVHQSNHWDVLKKAAFQKQLQESGANLNEVNVDEEYWNYYDEHLQFHKLSVQDLDLCYKKRQYDKEKLESIYLDKYEIFQFCLNNEIPPPKFWYSEAEIKTLSSEEKRQKEPTSKPKLRDNQIDKLLCRAIAQTIWYLKPETNITEMCEHHAIQIFGNAKQYKSQKNIRTWIADLDPRPADQKQGRPKKKTTHTD